MIKCKTLPIILLGAIAMTLSDVYMYIHVHMVHTTREATPTEGQTHNKGHLMHSHMTMYICINYSLMFNVTG